MEPAGRRSAGGAKPAGREGAGGIELAGRRFTAGEVLLVWTYDGPLGPRRRAMTSAPGEPVLAALERVLRRLPGGRARLAAVKRELHRLERPGEALLGPVTGGHAAGLVRPWRPAGGQDTAAEPAVLDLGDRRTFFAFADVADARTWAAAVHRALGRVPAWQRYATGPGLEAELDAVLTAERRRRRKLAAAQMRRAHEHFPAIDGRLLEIAASTPAAPGLRN